MRYTSSLPAPATRDTRDPEPALRRVPDRRNLLSRPGPPLLATLDQALAALARAFPVPSGHRKDLPLAVRDLSRMLTSERRELSRSYWSSPRLMAAYLHFFLPWNLYRLSWLLPSLDISLPLGAHLLDLGSGPLTLPLALWCCRPDLRSVPLRFTCCDVALQPMELGRTALRELAGEDSPWRITLVRAPLEKALRLPSDGGFACIMAGNVLNELCTRSGLTDSAMVPRLETLMARAFAALSSGGRLFLLEPGTRLGGKLISLSRASALQQGFRPLAPCPHAGPCPMVGSEPGEGAAHGRQGQAFSGWCHFIHPAGMAPAALAELGRKAHLEKDNLSLSCLLLQKTEGPSDLPAALASATAGDDPFRNDLDELEALYAEIMEEDERERAPAKGASVQGLAQGLAQGLESRAAPPHRSVPAEHSPGSSGTIRVVSAPIRLPGQDGPGRYACCEKGLALLLNSLRVPSGACVTLPWPEEEERDGKTGALLLRLTPPDRNADPPQERRTPPPAPKERTVAGPRRKQRGQSGQRARKPKP